MKTIVSALIALSVLAGARVPANALDPKTCFDQQERWSAGSTCRARLVSSA